MNDRTKNIIIIVITSIVSIFLGYAIMYIKTPNDVVAEKQIKDEKLNIKSINFSDYLYDVDGDDNRSISVKVLNQKAFIGINEKEFPINNYEKVKSVRVEHTTKDEGYNIIYILSNSLLYYITDLEYMEAIEKRANPEFKLVDLENIISIATMVEYSEEYEYKYPTVYAKTYDGKIYYSKFNEEFKLLEE